MTDKLTETILAAIEKSYSENETWDVSAKAAADAVRAMVPDLVWRDDGDSAEIAAGPECEYRVWQIKSVVRMNWAVVDFIDMDAAKAAADAHNRDRVAKLAGWV